MIKVIKRVAVFDIDRISLVSAFYAYYMTILVIIAGEFPAWGVQLADLRFPINSARSTESRNLPLSTGFQGKGSRFLDPLEMTQGVVTGPDSPECRVVRR
jgi:hypothetical protein